MKLRLTREASSELANIIRAISNESPSGAARVRRRVRDCFDLIRQFPAVGRETRNVRIRRLVTAPYPYLVFYELRRDAAVVIAVRHGARDPATMPGGGDPG